MPRPRTPLISRESAARSALVIIDERGLDGLSLEKLADAMGVRAPSLYHHFSDKAEILAEVARLIILETPLPRRQEFGDWGDWFVRLAVNFRRVILRHANAAPLLLQFLPRDVLTYRYSKAVEYLAAVRVPTELHVLIVDGLDKFTIGAALMEAMQPGRFSRHVFPAAEPSLRDALEANTMSADQLFEAEVRSFLDGVISRRVNASS